MEHCSSCLRSWVLLRQLQNLVILLSVLNLLSTTTAQISNEVEKLALLAFKGHITEDPFQVMSSWNDSTHFCQWLGVSCNPSNQSVLALRLESMNLVGSLSPSIGNLTSLTTINLTDNNFHGEIPQEIGRLVKLKYLHLRMNSFTGHIPSNLTHCLDLTSLNLLNNEFVGNIPDHLSSLTKLVFLNLGRNNLTGRIPIWLSNFSSMVQLRLQLNNLQGEIPEQIGRLTRLEQFQVGGNRLSGIIPSSIYNMSSIKHFVFAKNQFHGLLPPDLGLSLPNLVTFAGSGNNLTGPFPFSFSNISRLETLELMENNLSGPLPTSIGRLTSLRTLRVGTNQLSFEGKGELDILTSLTNCTYLKNLDLSNNNLVGILPKSIANLSSHLSWLTLGQNQLSGNIPTGIQNLVNLRVLGLEINTINGIIPDGIGKLERLELLYLNNNQISGLIPSSIGNLSQLSSLILENNRLEGSIPPSLVNSPQLIYLTLQSNNLNGTIPKQIFNLSSLSIMLDLSSNSLTGSLPLEVGKLKNLGQLYLSNNKLFGDVPDTLANCISLEHLDMSNNNFQGAIPPTFSTLRAIKELDLSDNNLSGKIPKFLETFPALKYLNLSFNNFDGALPKQGIFSDPSGISDVRNNTRLCGGNIELQLPVCATEPSHKPHKFLPLKVIIPVAFGVLLIVLLSFLVTWFWIKKLRKRIRRVESTTEDGILSLSYMQLFKSTNGFSKDKLIGVGSFGSVYKAMLHGNGTIIAVKVLNLEQPGASKSFIAECEALRNIRHRNLLKVLTVCSSVDTEGNDFKALVFELMSNGNLDQWLHPRNDGEHLLKGLNLTQKLNIAIDVALALEYLHHNCETPIAHCDLKPTNILLNEDMTAHVSDFGLAKFIYETTENACTTQSLGLKGSIGYIPPEYGMGGQVSIYGDIYSYGILLLEMFTGKRPTENMFKDGESLHTFATRNFPYKIMEIIDPMLVDAIAGEEGQIEDNNEIELENEEIVEVENSIINVASGLHECLVSVFKIGISCSMPSPSNRPIMKDVVSQMKEIRKAFLELSRRRQGESATH